MCHTEPYGCHCICVGVSCGAVSDQFSFDAIFLCRKEEANEGGGGAGGGGSCDGLGGLISHKNWISRRLKGVETVSVLPDQYSPIRERKKKAIQARSAIDFSLGDLLLVTESMQWRM